MPRPLNELEGGVNASMDGHLRRQHRAAVGAAAKRRTQFYGAPVDSAARRDEVIA
jgi:hypothetical protein